MTDDHRATHIALAAFLALVTAGVVAIAIVLVTDPTAL